MATINIFASFEFDKDRNLKNSFFEQGRLLNPDYRIKSCSLNETLREGDWQQKARAMIEQCDVVIVLLGADTHSARGVKTEVRIANRLKKRIFQIKPQRRRNRKGVANAGEVITWRWKRINRKLNKMFG